ncbi:MAG: tRNA (adenosine(37)-N6)-threonylcarbamoyltransferase complex dimerization subunit type 1 TsaB [Nocardioidaceae bacterium]
MLLAFDTATYAVTVALHDGTEVVAEWTVVDGLRHGELLALGIDAVLAQATTPIRAVSRVAVGVGPGPFTGLRVGVVTARTLAAALGVEVVGVCSLDVVAGAVEAAGPFVVATDARRKEVYWARYGSPYERVGGPQVVSPGDVATEEPVAGRGAAMYPEAFPHAVAPEYPSAAVLARMVAEAAAPMLPPEPLYLRRPDVAKPGARKRVL